MTILGLAIFMTIDGHYAIISLSAYDAATMAVERRLINPEKWNIEPQITKWRGVQNGWLRVILTNINNKNNKMYFTVGCSNIRCEIIPKGSQGMLYPNMKALH